MKRMVWAPLAALVLLVVLCWPALASLPASPVDLVVALGGDDRRKPVALDLLNRSLARHLLFTDEAANRKRGKDLYADYSVPREKEIRVEVEPQDTFAEARLVYDVMTRQGFKSAVVVTSDYHVRRARYIFKKVFRIFRQDEQKEVWVYGAGAHDSSSQRKFNEFFALVRAMLKPW